MFFLKYLEHRTELHPSYFGPSMVEFLNQKLRDDVEGTCTGRHGYIIKVVGVTDVGQGKVMPGTGLAEFTSKYQAIVLKPVSHPFLVPCAVGPSRLNVMRMRGAQLQNSSKAKW